MKECDMRRVAEMIEAVRQTNISKIYYETDEMTVVVVDNDEGEVVVRVQFND